MAKRDCCSQAQSPHTSQPEPSTRCLGTRLLPNQRLLPEDADELAQHAPLRDPPESRFKIHQKSGPLGGLLSGRGTHSHPCGPVSGEGPLTDGSGNQTPDQPGHIYH